MTEMVTEDARGLARCSHQPEKPKQRLCPTGAEPLLSRAEARGFEPRMGGKPKPH
jgi:hypothetical protein